jgi:hypothetical protein
MNEQEIREALDACRPNGDDLSLPELAALAETLQQDPRWRAVYERSQSCDNAIRQAFHEVPVPAGLGERLLAAVSQAALASASQAATPEHQEARAAATVELPGATSWRGALRRNWKTHAAALATVAVALTLAVVFHGSRDRLPELSDDFSREVIGWTEEVQQGTWREDLPAATCPLDPAIRAKPRRWCQMATAYDPHTLVYDLTPPGRDFAFAFCIPTRGRPSALPTMPPANPFSTTGGVSLGAWQSQGMVYVLTVQGGQNRYQGFINARVLIGWRPSHAVSAFPLRKV